MKIIRRSVGESHPDYAMFMLIHPKNWVNWSEDDPYVKMIDRTTLLGLNAEWNNVRRERYDLAITKLCSKIFVNNLVREYFNTAVVSILPVLASVQPEQPRQSRCTPTSPVERVVPVITPMDSQEGVIPRAVYFGLPHAHTSITSVVDLPAFPYHLRRRKSYRHFKRYMSYNWEGICRGDILHDQKQLPLVSEDHTYEAVLLRFSLPEDRGHRFTPHIAPSNYTVHRHLTTADSLYYRHETMTSLASITGIGNEMRNRNIFVDHIQDDQCPTLYSPNSNELTRQFLSVLFYPKEQSIVIPYSFQNGTTYESADFRSIGETDDREPLFLSPRNARFRNNMIFGPHLETMLQIMHTEGWLKRPYTSHGRYFRDMENCEYNHKITIGCDPEFELTLNQTIVRVRGDLYNQTWEPSVPGIDSISWKSRIAPHIKRTISNTLNSSIGADGAGSQVEMRPSPAETPEQLVENVRVLMAEVNDLGTRLANYNVTLGLSSEGDKFPLGGHIHIGLERTRVSYGSNNHHSRTSMWKETHPTLIHRPITLENILSALGYTDRSSGSPISPSDKSVLVGLFDAYLGKHCAALNGTARGSYATVGACRDKQYGLEYRTLPAAVFNNPRIAFIVCSVVKQLTERYYGGVLIKVPEDQIELAAAMEDLGISRSDTKYLISIWAKGLPKKLTENVVAAWMRNAAPSEADEIAEEKSQDEPESIYPSTVVSVTRVVEIPGEQTVTPVYGRIEEHESTEERGEPDEVSSTHPDESVTDDQLSIYEWYERCTQFPGSLDYSGITPMWRDDWCGVARTKLVSLLHSPQSEINRTYSLLRSLNPEFTLSVTFYGLHEERGNTAIGVSVHDLRAIRQQCESSSPEGIQFIGEMLYVSNIIGMENVRNHYSRNTQMQLVVLTHRTRPENICLNIGISRDFRVNSTFDRMESLYMDRVDRIMSILIAAKLYDARIQITT